MKKKIFVAALLIAVTMICVCSCSSKFNYDGDMLVDKKSGIKYNYAPFNYEPTELGKKYATQKVSGIEAVYYTIGDLSANEWLANEDLTVFYAEGVHLPTFEEMSPDRILVCEEDYTTSSIADITDSEAVTKILEEYKNGFSFESSSVIVSTKYSLKFRSSSYPYLQYSLSYLEYEEGLVISDKIESTEDYKYLFDEKEVEISLIQNDDGSTTVKYDLGKYFLYSKWDGVFVRIGSTLSDKIG